jgi:hypothetical protein
VYLVGCSVNNETGDIVLFGLVTNLIQANLKGAKILTSYTYTMAYNLSQAEAKVSDLCMEFLLFYFKIADIQHLQNSQFGGI